MPKASELASELRSFADRLDGDPDAVLDKAFLSLRSYERKQFLNCVRLMPRPLKKTVQRWTSEPDLEVSHDSDALCLYATAPQALTCRIVTPAQPAVYDCDPLLSAEEESTIEV